MKKHTVRRRTIPWTEVMDAKAMIYGNILKDTQAPVARLIRSMRLAIHAFQKEVRQCHKMLSVDPCDCWTCVTPKGGK